LARRIGARPAEAYGLTLLGSWELHQGNYLAATDRFREARSAQQRLRNDHGIVAAALGAGLALYHLGDLAQGRRLLRGAVRRARSIAHRRRLAESLVALGLLETAAASLGAARSCLLEAVELARDGECWESVAAGLAALARVERTRGNVYDALERTGEAIRVARRRELSAVEVWARTERGLALLDQGDLTEAVAETGQAVAEVSNLHEAWIGTEEVHRAHARVLRALGRTKEAREQDELAEAVIQSKADGIPDPEARRCYLQHAQGEASDLKS
jgi:tetratricopeptide (TPR) repeat protein